MTVKKRYDSGQAKYSNLSNWYDSLIGSFFDFNFYVGC